MAKTIIHGHYWSFNSEILFPKTDLQIIYKNVKIKRRLFFARVTSNADVFYKPNWYFPNKNYRTDILFCLISGDIQHSILRKVSYLNKTKRLNKTSLYTDFVLFFFSFFLKTSASENEREARETKIEFSPSPPPTPSAGGH